MPEKPCFVKEAAPAEAIHGVNLAKEADHVLQIVQQNRGKLIVLYGQRKSGKSELIRRWVVPRLAGKENAWYGECFSWIPTEFVCKEDTSEPDWKSLPAGIYFLDAFDRLFGLDAQAKRESMRAINTAIQVGHGNVTIALVLRESSLRELFFFPEMPPDAVNHRSELPVPSFEDALKRLSVGHPGVSFGTELFEAIHDDLQSFQDKGSLLLAELLYPRLASMAKTGGGVEQYREAGGVRGLLNQIVIDKLEEIRSSLGPEGVLGGEAVLKDVSQKEGTEPDVREISSRLEIDETIVKRAYEWLKDRQGLLHPMATGGVEIEPPQLAQNLREQTSRRSQRLSAAVRIAEEGVKSWRTVGTVFPKKGFEEVDRFRHDLTMDQDAAALMVHCALLHKNDEEDPDLKAARYWLGRIPDEHERVASLTRGLVAPEPEIRRKAARLLQGRQQAGVAAQLYRVALGDPQPEVRSEAIAGLKHLSVVPDEVRSALEEAATDPHSLYRANAVECLQIFPDKQTVAVLCRIANDENKKIRAVAIKTLAKVSTAESAAALVDLGLTDEDREKRRQAAAALGEIESPELQSDILKRIRQKPVGPWEEPRGGRADISLVHNWLAAIGIALGNVLFPGLALERMGRYWPGVAFLAVNAVLCALGSAIAAFHLPGRPIFWGAWGALILVNQIVTFHEAIKDRRHPQRLSGMQAALGFSIFGTNTLTSFLLFHGLAHILLKRPRRGITLLAAEALGLMPALIFLFYEYLFVTTAWRTWQILTSITFGVYLVLTIFILCGSHCADLVGGYRLFRRLNQSRQDFLLERVLGSTGRTSPEKSSAVSVLFSLLHSSDKRERRWAQNKLFRFSEVLPANELLEYLVSGKAPAPRHLLRALRKNKRAHKDPEFLKNIEQKYAVGDAALRRNLQWILAGSPSQISLETLNRLSGNEGILARLRYYKSNLRYRWALAPQPVVALGALFAVLLPLEMLLLVDGIYTSRHEEWPLVRLMWRGGPQTNVLNQFLTHWKPWSLRPEDRTGKHARALAASYPDSAVLELAKLFHDLNRTPKGWSKLRPVVAESLGMAATQAHDPMPAVQELAEGDRSPDNSVRNDARKGLDSAVPGANADFVKRIDSLLADSSEKDSAFYLLVHIALVSTEEQLRRQEENTKLPEESKLQEEAKLQAFESLYKHADLASFRRALCSDQDPRSAKIVLLALQWKGEQQAVDTLSDLALAPSLTCGGNRSAAADTGQVTQGAPSSMPFEQLQALAVDSLAAIGTEEARLALRRIQEQSPSDYLKAEAQTALNRRVSEALDLEGADFYRNHDYVIAAAIVQKSIEKDPAFLQSFSLLRAIFVDQERYPEAETLFNSLITRYPREVSPRRELAFLEHEYLHTEPAFETAYQRNQEALNMVNQPAEREVIRADLAECSLTTRRYAQAIKLAHQAARNLQDPGYKVSMSVVAYAAAVSQGNYAAAQKELTRLQQAVGHHPFYKTLWIYDGTFEFLKKTREIPPEIQSPLLTLVQQINQFSRAGSNIKDDRSGLNLKTLDRRVFDENRAALKLAARRKSGQR